MYDTRFRRRNLLNIWLARTQSLWAPFESVVFPCPIHGNIPKSQYCCNVSESAVQEHQCFSSYYYNATTKNPHPRHQHYSKDFRARVIHQKFKLNKQTPDIAIDLDMSLRVVQWTIKLWHEVGDVVAEPKKLSRAPIMSPTQIQVCILLLV